MLALAGPVTLWLAVILSPNSDMVDYYVAPTKVACEEGADRVREQIKAQGVPFTVPPCVAVLIPNVQ